MNNVSNVWVFSDTESRFPETIAAACSVGSEVHALVIGGELAITSAQAYGAHCVYHLGDHLPERIVEDYADTMAGLIAEKPGLVLLPGTRRCKALAALLGVKLGAGVISDAADLDISEQGVSAHHLVYGGLAQGQTRVSSETAIVVLAGGAFAPAEMGSPEGSMAQTIAFVEPARQVRCVERRPLEESSVDLNKAKRIVGIGRGIANKADIELAAELATALGAELGCSRPIAESEKWMEQARYIGISGVMPKPEFYLTLGISGQVQHMVGANGAQLILAVNKDKNAPIFQYADYGIVGDLYKVVPVLTAAFK